MSTKTLTKKVAVASVPEVTELFMTEVSVKLRETSETSKKSVTISGYDEENREYRITIPLKKAPANLEKLIPVDAIATITRGAVVDAPRRHSLDDLWENDEE